MTLQLRWVDAVALALAKHGGKTHLNKLYNDAPRIYGKRPATFESRVRSTLESHSSDSDTFDPNNKDLFTLPSGKGCGVWALRDTSWTIDDVITIYGQFALLTEITKVYPSSMSGHANPGLKLKGSNLIEFAQQLLPGLPLWMNAD